MNANTALLVLFALPLLASPVIYLVGRITVKVTRDHTAKWPARGLTVVVLLAALATLVSAAQSFFINGPFELHLNQIALRLDGVSLLMSFVAIVLGLVVALFSSRYMAGEENEEKFYALLAALVGALIGMSCAVDLFNLWVWFEAMSITSVMLVAFYKNQAAALEASIKYLVQSAVGSVFILFGISLVYAFTGALNLSAIQANLSQPSPLLMVAASLFVIGFGVKAALVPLHTWLPDAHSQAPSGISAMLSGIVIEAALLALLRTLSSLTDASVSPGAILLTFGALNILVGNLMALRQTQVKRLLAYSSVAHMGYILLGFGFSLAYGNLNGAQGAFFHILNHAAMKGLAFLSVGAVMYVLLIANHNHRALELQDLNGLSQRYPLLAFTLSLAVLALGGMPPLAGFMSKWQIFVAGAQASSPAVLTLVIFAGLNSVLSLGYYAPLVNRMYRRQPAEVIAAGKPLTFSLALSLVLLSLPVVILGFWPSLATPLTEPAARALLAVFGL